jgi:hypothetical protein
VSSVIRVFLHGSKQEGGLSKQAFGSDSRT